jgi:hypothetical protein
MVDVAPTLATLLGANLPATGQGRPRSEMLELGPQQAARLNTALAAQQAQMVNAYLAAIGHQPASIPNADTTAYQSALQDARAARLSQERLLRIPLVLIVWLVPLALLVVRRSRSVAWGVAGALVYLALFNLRYALLDHRVYSFSAILSPTEVALYIAITSILALTIVWVVTLASGGGFRQGGRRAAEIALLLTAINLYGLSLPVGLSLALNGPVAAWTLPDFASLYLALLSALQMAVVGVWGAALAGLAAFIGARLKPGMA